MVVAATAGMHIKGSSRTAYIGVGTPGLRDGKIPDSHFTVEIAATGKVHFQTVRMNGVFEIDVGAPGSMQLIDRLTRYIGFQMLVTPMPPMHPTNPVILDID